MSPTRGSSKAVVPLIVCALSLMVLCVYWQVGGHSFIGLDDDQYVYENPSVLKGLAPESISWAFTTFHSANWHPLTWLSHMADVEWFGLDAGWHHRVNVLLHLANTVLLFLVLWRMTGGLWESAFVAALFGVHPLHVESVAWVAERKDVLSTLFWILTMGAYLRYVERPGVGRYLLVAVSFALGLMCKPMLVTLPFVLLLLDWWPLRRFGEGPFSPRTVYALIREKIPLLVFSAASSLVAPLAQSRGGAMIPLWVNPLGLRVSNAIVSYVKYLGKMVWPASLAVFYPHPAITRMGLPMWQVAGAVLLLGGVTSFAIWQWKRRPYLAVGWLWYLGTLLPVIGVVQVGSQAMADRYTYVPLIGIFIVIAWGAPEALRGWRLRRHVLGAIGGAVIIASGICAWNQTRHWRDSMALFTHALKVTEDNGFVWNNLGAVYSRLHQPQEAISSYREAIRIVPFYADAWFNLGMTYDDLGQYQEAISCYREVLRLKPNSFQAWANLGSVFDNLGQHLEAIDCYREAVRIKPDEARTLYNLGVAYYRLRQPQQAIPYYLEALRIHPDFANAWYALGIAYSRLGEREHAREAHQRLLRIDPAMAGKLLSVLGPEK